MTRGITIVDVKPAPIAVVRRTTTLAELPRHISSLLDVVYAAVRTGTVRQYGHNVVVYRNMTGGRVDVECGVQVAATFEDVGEVRCRDTPGGEAATLVHMGPYARLPESHAMVVDWTRKHGRRRAGVSWEVYGDWNDDPAQLRTDVYHLLEPE